MIINVKDFKSPTSLSEALQLRAENESSRFLAGGVILSRTIGASVEMLIDLTHLPLDYIKTAGDEIKIGAMVRINDLYRNTELTQLKTGKILSEVSGYVASEQIRNMATVGGAIFAKHYWSDIIPMFMVLNAKLIFENLNGEFTEGIEDFLNPKNHKKFQGSILKEISIQKLKGDYKFYFESISRTKVDIATLNLAVLYLITGDKKVEDIRISSGGLEPVIRRYSKVENYLTGKKLTKNNLIKAAELLLEKVTPITDLRGSSEYKATLIKTLFPSILV